MPLHWMIDSRERLMTAAAEGGVRKDEMDAYLDAIDGARAGDYRQLFDGSVGEPLMTPGHIMSLAVRMRGMQQLGLAGPLAIIMPRDKYDRSPACWASWPSPSVPCSSSATGGRAGLAGRAGDPRMDG